MFVYENYYWVGNIEKIMSKHSESFTEFLNDGYSIIDYNVDLDNNGNVYSIYFAYEDLNGEVHSLYCKYSNIGSTVIVKPNNLPE